MRIVWYGNPDDLIIFYFRSQEKKEPKKNQTCILFLKWLPLDWCVPWFGQAHGLSKIFIEVKSCESDWFKYNVFYSDKCYDSYSMDLVFNLQLYSNVLGWSPKGASEFSWFFVWAVKLSKFFSHIWQSPGGHLIQAMYLGLAWIIAIPANEASHRAEKTRCNDWTNFRG